jgi:antitoxin YefM
MAATASDARARLFPLIEQVNADQEPVEIVSKKGTVFLTSEAQYRSMAETANLVRSPANAERLLKGVAQASAAKASERALIVE